MRFQACSHKLQELPEALGSAFLNHRCDHRLEPVAHVDHHYHLRVTIIEPEAASLSPIHRWLRGHDILSHNIVPGGEILGFDAAVRCSLDITSGGLGASSYLSAVILRVLHNGCLSTHKNTKFNLE